MSRARHRDVREIVRDEPFMRRRILVALAAGPLTVPEIAAVCATLSRGDVLGDGVAQVRVARRVKEALTKATSAIKR